MNEIIERIKDLTLTKGETKIADYFTEHTDTMGLVTSSVLAQQIGVSNTSLINFVRKIGYPSYAQFRASMNDNIAQQLQKAGETPEFSPEGNEGDEGLTTFVHSKTISDNMLENIVRTFNQADEATVMQIVQIILNSKHKYVAGFHTTAGCAQYMSTRLVKLVPYVIPLTNADASSIETILDIGPEDCLIVYTFLKNSLINGPLIDLAKQNGAKVILITDKASSPLAKKADILLLAPVENVSFAFSYLAPLSISELILMMLTNEGGNDGEERLRKLEEIIEHSNLF